MDDSTLRPKRETDTVGQMELYSTLCPFTAAVNLELSETQSSSWLDKMGEIIWNRTGQ